MCKCQVNILNLVPKYHVSFASERQVQWQGGTVKTMEHQACDLRSGSNHPLPHTHTQQVLKRRKEKGMYYALQHNRHWPHVAIYI